MITTMLPVHSTPNRPGQINDEKFTVTDEISLSDSTRTGKKMVLQKLLFKQRTADQVFYRWGYYINDQWVPNSLIIPPSDMQALLKKAQELKWIF